MTATALIIDDEPDIRELIAMTLTRMGLDHHSAANLEEARQLLNTYKFDVCLTDMRLPDGNGVDFVRYIQSKNPSLPVAVITAHGNMEAAVEAMKNGAYDFVSKPVDIQQLRQLVVQAVALNSEESKLSAVNDPSYTTDVQSQSAGEQSNNQENQVVGPPANLHALSGRNGDHRNTATDNDLRTGSGRKLIGGSEPMRNLRQMIAKVARTNAPVWITGESGTGKELIARLIHENSTRSNAAFVGINCGAIPTELMESEFFGHIKGSFTGASADKEGLFQLAHGGTLFLDEVAELPLHMQVKLLRAIQERSIRPVGSSGETSVDARILSASHKDLAVEVEANRFRHDLYYRLNVISLHSPSLRSRREDIPELCQAILDKLGKQSETAQHKKLSHDALEAMAAYHFPGNVRELENLLERATALIESHTITASDLQLPSNQSTLGKSNLDSVDANNTVAPSGKDERSRILDTLNTTRWNRKEAAKILGLTYRQLRYRIQQLGIDANKD